MVEEDYKQFAENDALRKETIYPARGLIYDRNRQILVRNVTIYDVMVTPSKVADLDTTAFCQLLEVNKTDFVAAFTKAKKHLKIQAQPCSEADHRTAIWQVSGKAI